MTITNRYLRRVLALALFIGMTACMKSTSTTPPNPVAPIATGAKITLEISKDLRTVEDGVRQANSLKLLSDADTAAVLRVTYRLNQAGLDANKVLRSQTTLAPDQKVSLTTLLTPLISAIQTAIDQDVIKITDANRRAQVQATLLAIQTTIKSTLAAIGAN